MALESKGNFRLPREVYKSDDPECVRSMVEMKQDVEYKESEFPVSGYVCEPPKYLGAVAFTDDEDNDEPEDVTQARKDPEY